MQLRATLALITVALAMLASEGHAFQCLLGYYTSPPTRWIAEISEEKDGRRLIGAQNGLYVFENDKLSRVDDVEPKKPKFIAVSDN